MHKAKQNERISVINWPLSAKLKCQHNKTFCEDKQYSISCAKCWYLPSWLQFILNKDS